MFDARNASVDEVFDHARRYPDLGNGAASLEEKIHELDIRKAELETKGRMLASEQREYAKLLTQTHRLTALLSDIQAKARTAKKDETEKRAAVDEARKQIPPSGETRLAVGNAESVYRQDRRDVSFFKDIINAKNDPLAMERLQVNQREQLETRDLTSSDPGAAGFIPPMYLSSAWADLPRAARPFADVVPKMPLPDVGLQASVPKVQSGVTVASQASENTAVSETDLDSQSITANVVTIAGLNDISLQALERSMPGMDQVIFQDLISAHDADLDRQLINGSGASGQHQGVLGVAGINGVTYTDGTPTGPELLPKIYDAIQQVASTRFRNANVIVMHPRRAAWLAKELSSTFPLFQQGQLTQAIGQQEGGFASSFGGLRVVLDPNVPTTLGAGTNEDRIIAGHVDDAILMEGPVMSVRFDDVGSANLTVRLRLHSFSVWIPHRQPKAWAVISGTGLATPSF